MPYARNEDLPESVKSNLPRHAQEIYRAAFNHAWDQYADPQKRRSDDSQETVAHKVAWSAVEKEYTKQADRWVSRPAARKS